MADLFQDPRQALKDRNAKLVIPESKIREAINHSNYIYKAAAYLNVSTDRFKNYAKKYLDPDTGLNLLELQNRNLLLAKAQEIGKKPIRTYKSYHDKNEFTEEEIRYAMSVTLCNKQAAEILGASPYVYKKCASAIIDEETKLSLFEIQYQKWKKYSFEKYKLRKEKFKNYDPQKAAEIKEKWEKQKFTSENLPPMSERPDNWKYKGLELSEEIIRGAMRNTRSNKEAAQWLRVSYKTWKKYAKMYIDQQTGRSLFNLHLSNGTSIPKARTKKTKNSFQFVELGYQLIKGQTATPKRIDQLASRLMKDGRLGYSCSECGYCSKRPIDMKMPLMINFINGDRSDWTESNLRWVCYNCAFILALDFTNRNKRQILQGTAPESPDAPQESESFYKIDDFYLEHLKSLGIGQLAEKVQEPIKDDKNPLPEDLIDYQ